MEEGGGGRRGGGRWRRGEVGEGEVEEGGGGRRGGGGRVNKRLAVPVALKANRQYSPNGSAIPAPNRTQNTAA